VRRDAFILAACLFALASCRAKRSDGNGAPRPVALVNGEPLTKEALERELPRVGAAGEGLDGALKRRVLQDAVDRALLLQQARARSIAVGQDQVERAMLSLHAEYPGPHFDKLLAEEHLSLADLRSRLKENLTIEKLFAEEVFPRVKHAEGELERHYGQHEEEFDRGEEVHAFQIVVRTDAEARRLREEVRRHPGSFEEVARRASIAPEGRSGGDLGWFGKGSGMPEVFDACFRLPLEAISEVTPSPYGFHLFKVVGHRPPVRRPFSEVRVLIARRLLRDKRARAQDEYLAVLRQRADIQIDQAALDALAR